MRQAKKQDLVGPGGDPTDSVSPLGIMKGRGWITQDEHDAGTHYAYLYGRVEGKTTTGPSAGAYDEKDPSLEDIKALFDEARDVLTTCGVAVKRAVENAAVFGGQWPINITLNLGRPGMIEGPLFHGLRALVKWEAGKWADKVRK